MTTEREGSPRLYWRKAKPAAEPLPAPSPEMLAHARRLLAERAVQDCSVHRLLACPRCGNRIGVAVAIPPRLYRRDPRVHQARCPEAPAGCGLWGPPRRGVQFAERAWNDPEWREEVGKG